MKTEEYQTKNTNIASYLSASGLKMTGTAENNGKVYFKFIPKEVAEKLEKKYFEGTATINPRDLFARLKDLRDLIFSRRSK